MKTIMLTFATILLFAITGLSQLRTSTQFDSFSKITSAGERKAKMLTLSPEDKLAVWSDQMRFAIDNEELTKQERDLITEVQTYLQVEYMSGAKALPIDLIERVKVTFQVHKDLYIRTFEIPNNRILSDGVMCPTKSTILPKTTKTTIVVNNSFPDCNCYWGWSCTSECTEPVGAFKCNQVINCGIFGGSRCTGICILD